MFSICASVFMCRKNRLTGACLVSAGLGMVLTLLLGSSVLAAIAALALLVFGLILAGKK